MQELEDQQTLALLKNGSLAAYETVFKKYYKKLCFQAFLFLKDETEAEDLVLELFIDIWHKKIYRRIDKSLEAYLCQSVRNKCINRVRKNKITRCKEVEYLEYHQQTRGPEWQEQQELGSSATNLNTLLLELPTQRLRAITLVYMEKKRYREAAEEMGLSVNSVKTHLRLAITALKDKIKRFG
ncbi:MAG TPA: sigma-70 family RNA polymerase sigma factor [Flavitalea sp.]|nr:sigma-70 family RNA polymerase sigma factor [Flavitalea sp.]